MSSPSHLPPPHAILSDVDLRIMTGGHRGTRVVPANTQLFRQGDILDGCYIILQGWVALTVVLPDGAQLIPDFAHSGELIGWSSADQPISHSAICLTLVTVVHLPRTDIDMVLDRHPTIARRLIQLIALQKDRLQDHLTNIAIRGAYHRVAHLLVELFVRTTYRPPEPGDGPIPLPLTHVQLGAATALTSVHISRVLRTMRWEGVADLRRGTLSVLDPAALLAAAAGPDEVRPPEPGVMAAPAEPDDASDRTPTATSHADGSPSQ